MSPETKNKLNKAATPAFRGTALITLLTIVAQNVFDPRIKQIANDVSIIKVTQQHMSKQQDASTIKIDKLEDRITSTESRCIQFNDKYEEKFAALWRAKQNKQ
jgi:hypothetical protein